MSVGLPKLNICWNVFFFFLLIVSVLRWIGKYKLPKFEIFSKFNQHKVTLENLKYMKHRDLMALGIKEWGLRTEIMQAIKDTFDFVPQHKKQIQQNIPNNALTPAKRKYPVDSLCF